MQRGATVFLRRLILLGVFAAGLGNAGCVPGVAWLPDSSGLVYTTKDFKQLVFYDVKKGERRILVADTGAGTLWPAVSPDGKRIAVAKFIIEPMQKQTRLQVILFDRQGKEIQRSKALNWLTLDDMMGRLAKEDTSVFPQLFWAPGIHGDRILIHTAVYTGIYDVKSGRMLHTGEGALLVFRGGPVRPDGAGFLVMKNYKGWTSVFQGKPAEDKDPHFAFVDWDGKEQPVKAPPFMLDRDALKKEKNSNKLMALFMPLLFESGWEGEVAQVRYDVDRLRYFTRKGEAVLDQVKPEMTEGGLVQSKFPIPGGQIRIVALIEQGTPQDAKGLRLEVLRRGKNPEVIVPRVEVCVPALSPNGEFVAFRCYTPGKGKDAGDRLILINKMGEVVANLQTQN